LALDMESGLVKCRFLSKWIITLNDMGNFILFCARIINEIK